MALFQRLYKKVLILVHRKKYYSMHYKMWDFIVVHLQSDSDELLSDAKYYYMNECHCYENQQQHQ